MDKPKIGIIITSFLRPKLLERSLNSILSVWQENWEIIIVDQSKERSLEPNLNYFNLHYERIPYNSGLSYARNYGVQKAKELDCEYCLITADSILFDENMNCVNYLLSYIPHSEMPISLLGLHLNNRIEWEAKLNLIEGKSFELNFIEKNNINKKSNIIWLCDIVRNFFIATTESLLKVGWDNNLKAGEHEDFFWRYKQQGYIVGCTKTCTGTYIGDESKNVGEYAIYRKQNFSNGIKALKEKYNIHGWVSYVNLERIKKDA
jgi:glycosyltransferase involved in cell wall biosynthesis